MQTQRRGKLMRGMAATSTSCGCAARVRVKIAAAKAAAAGPYDSSLQASNDRTRKAFGSAQTPAQAAVPIIEALTADRPAFRIQTSDRARDFVGVKLVDLDGSAVVGDRRGGE